MPTDTRTPDEIERDIERERAGLAHAVDALQDKFSFDSVVREIAGGFRRHGGDFGTAVSRSAKQNPVALAITGIGLAWLMFGRSHDDPADRIRRSRTGVVDDGLDDDWDETSSVGSTYRSPSSPTRDPVDAYGISSARSDAFSRTGTVRRDPAYPDWARHDLDDHEEWGEDDDDHGTTRSLGQRAADAARSGAGSVSSGARSTAGGVGRAARGAGDRIGRARERLARGTEDLSDAARERVIAARARAVEMAQRADGAARRNYARGRDAASDFIEEQPLVAGAIALAVGAALAGALPRTRREDEALGEARDDLFDEAERIFRQERRKAERVLDAAVGEAGKIAQEKRDAADQSAPGEKSAVDAAADEARDAGKRVRDAAEGEAKKQDLGNPRS